jgi:hypothetical protein
MQFDQNMFVGALRRGGSADKVTSNIQESKEKNIRRARGIALRGDRLMNFAIVALLLWL